MNGYMTVDGVKVPFDEGMTVLEASGNAGIHIPALCHLEGVSPYGACRLCTVEIIRGTRKELVASCLYPASDGLNVETNSPRVRKARRLLLELLLTRAPNVSSIREMAQEYGVHQSRFSVEPYECILCGLCVRYCAEVKKRDAVGWVGRGASREVMFYCDVRECIQCGACTEICPTGIFPSIYGLATVPHLGKPQ